VTTFALKSKKTTIIDSAMNTLTGTSFGSFLSVIIYQKLRKIFMGNKDV
jgi:hypothetical protein